MTVALADLYNCRVIDQGENQNLILRSQGEAIPAADQHSLAVDATSHVPFGVTRGHRLTAVLSVDALPRDWNPSVFAELHFGAGPDHHTGSPGRSTDVHAGLAAAGSNLDLKQH